MNNIRNSNIHILKETFNVYSCDILNRSVCPGFDRACFGLNRLFFLLISDVCTLIILIHRDYCIRQHSLTKFRANRIPRATT